MRLGRSHGEQQHPADDPADETVTSELGWVSIDADRRRWILCPLAFPAGCDRDSWAAEAAAAWLERWGLPADTPEAESLAAMLRLIHERANVQIKCHQIWIYLPDRFTTPLPVFLAVWRQSGDRYRRLRMLTEADKRLRMLTEADNKSGAREPQTDEVTTEHLGTGLQVLHQRTQGNGELLAFLAYAFRVEEHATDLQLFTLTSDLRALMAASDDIGRLVQGITVYRNTDERLVVEA